MDKIFPETVTQWLQDPFARKLLMAALGIIIILIVTRFIGRSVALRFNESSARYRVRKLTGFFGYLIVFLFLSILFIDRLGNLAFIFGVMGAGVAFSLQEVFASVAGWAGITFGHFFKVGDRIQLGGITGDVIDVGVLRTTLMECGQWIKGDLYTGRIVLVANSFVFKEPVFNYSGDFPFLWDEIVVPIRQGSDWKMAESILNKVASNTVAEISTAVQANWDALVNKYMIENARVQPMVTLIFNDNWIEFTLRYVVDYKMRRRVKDQLFRAILTEIEQTQGRVVIASTTLELVQPPAKNSP
ncbi:MAG: mechanosensitive ion channel domain-containing protein [Gallionella sp.]|jgi:small-conductance mechanosensitive channel